MTAETRTDRFVEALHRMDEGEAAPLLELFAEGATLQRPEKDASGADQGPEEFWRQYREVFSSLSTEFVSVREEGDLGVLEWTSTGTLTTGRMTLVDVVASEGADRDEVLRLAGALEDASEHPIARAVASASCGDARPCCTRPSWAPIVFSKLEPEPEYHAWAS